jgi:hypothetical protein
MRLRHGLQGWEMTMGQKCGRLGNGWKLGAEEAWNQREVKATGRLGFVRRKMFSRSRSD